MGTLLTGGIPLVQAMETAADSLNTPLLEARVETAGKSVREGQPLSGSLKSSGMFPGLATDMIEVGESTGALPAMLNSVAEFFEEDVNTKMTATLSLIEPAIMIVMGIVRGVCVDCVVPADLLVGGHDPVERAAVMATIDKSRTAGSRRRRSRRGRSRRGTAASSWICGKRPSTTICSGRSRSI